MGGGLIAREKTPSKNRAFIIRPRGEKPDVWRSSAIVTSASSAFPADAPASQRKCITKRSLKSTRSLLSTSTTWSAAAGGAMRRRSASRRRRALREALELSRSRTSPSAAWGEGYPPTFGVDGAPGCNRRDPLLGSAGEIDRAPSRLGEERPGGGRPGEGKEGGRVREERWRRES